MNKKRMLALLLAALMLVTLFAGCGGDTSTDTTTGDTTTGDTSTGDSAGDATSADGLVEFNLALNQDLYAMNLGGADSGMEGVAFPLLYDYLIYRNEEGELIPRLWTSWEVSDDGLDWTITLREGVTFHNGEPFTSEAMKVTYEWFATDETLSIHPTWEKLEEVEIVDDTTCIFHFREVDALFITNIANSGCFHPAYVEPNAFNELGIDAYFEHPIGCGPYSFVSWDPGNELILERDPNYDYWDDTIQTNIDRYVISSVTEDMTRVSSMRTGESDMILSVPYEQMETLQSTEGVKIEQIDGSTAYWMGIECGEGYIFNDPNLRQALSECVDRAAIATSIYGLAEPLYWYVPSYCNAYDESAIGQYYQYDPDHARELVANSDYDGTPIRLIAVNSFAKVTELSQAMVSMLQDAGFVVDLQMIEHSALNETRGSGNYDIFLSNYAFGTDASFFLQIQIVNDRGHFELNNEELNSMILEANQIIDEEERASVMREVCRMAAEIYGPQQPLFTLQTTMATKENVTGYVLHPNMSLYLFDMVVG